MNEIVKYHNDMASVNFPDFSPTDHNVFLAICYECKDKGTDTHPIYLSYLKELSGFSSKDDKRFIRYIKDLTGKMHSMYYREEKEDGGFKSFSLFPTFETVDMNTSKAALLVRVNEDFAYILNSEVNTPDGVLPLLNAGYTTFELRAHNDLKSVYSKIAFRNLKRFKRTGWWQVTLEEFRRLLDIPESYKMKEVSRRVVKPIMEELPPYFDDLKLEYIKGGPSGRQVVALKFTFKPQIERGIWTEREIFETKYCCPKCGKPLYSIWKANGDEFFGHKDGWKADAPCRRTYSSLKEVIRDIEEKGETVPEEIRAAAAEKDEKGDGPTRAGFSCRECGRPLYILHNKKGEQFYGHIDGWKKDAPCRKTYGSIAEIKGLSETPTREDSYTLVARGTENENSDSAQGVFDTISHIIEAKKEQQQ